MSLTTDLLIVCIVQLFIKCVVSQEHQQQQQNVSSTASTLQIFGKCFRQADIVECLREQMVTTIDTAIQDNSTWQLNDFISLEPNPNYNLFPSDDKTKSRENEDDSMMTKVKELLRSRRIEIKSDLMPMDSERGRKKKNKHGSMVLMSGIAMAAMFAQVVLGKVALIASAALILAKIALFVSTTSSLKKQATASSTDHVVYADHGHSGHGGTVDGYSRSYYRPMRDYPYPYEDSNDELKDRDIELQGM